MIPPTPRPTYQDVRKPRASGDDPEWGAVGLYEAM